ncbi:Mbov_0399 family ICE element protein [Mycoplasmopsis glycophila]|uniref:Uncharacterized protein n=1 Tax=Mycoplasmopsis glycophila TaxID=171285 RepID=A0A449AV50_9BACT|nr:hypothetical protein [Mycoplasmopsis glycophila]VEU70350.1 Uncharacterised protein [Mycoplasmopsis glycophila]
MFYKKLDIKRTAFSYALIEKKTNAEKYMNTVLQDYKYIVRQLAFENVKINEKQAEALLSSEAIISPKINHDSYYGWENGVAKHINHLGLYDSVIPLHFENRKYSKSSLNSSGIQNILLEKAKSKIADNEDILINETKIEKDYQVVVKAFILSDNENKNQRDWLPYAPNMIINNNRQLRDNFILWEDNLKLNVEIYAPQTNYVVINNDNAKISQIVSNYEKAFLKAQNELKNTQTLNIVSERIGDRTLYSLENQSLLNQKINEINKKLMEYNFFIEYKVIDEDKIDLYLSNKTNSLINKSYKIASNYPVKISPSVRAIDKEIKNRLIIKANKWVDFKTNTTELVDDVPVLLEPQAKKGEKSFYGGKWLYHSPASVDFTTIDESEILLINGKRIEVLDRHFSEILSNESLIIDNSSKEEENKIKSYEIKILKYEKNSGNVDSKLEYEYKIDLLINSNALSIDYKFYAWNPEENPDQKKLIEEYKKMLMVIY